MLAKEKIFSKLFSNNNSKLKFNFKSKINNHIQKKYLFQNINYNLTFFKNKNCKIKKCFHKFKIALICVFFLVCAKVKKNRILHKYKKEEEIIHFIDLQNIIQQSTEVYKRIYDKV